MGEAEDRNMVEAINLTLDQAMDRDDEVLVLGEDVGVDGGIFRVTDGLIDKYGEERVVDTPLAEAGIVGTAIGLAVYGFKPIAELQFSGFSYHGYYQLEGHAARLRTRTRGRLTCPMVVRCPYGAGVHALEHHSESKEMIYAHTPGLKMVIPSTPRKARGLLFSAIEDPDPVVYFEPKLVYRQYREAIDEDEDYEVEIGQAEVVKEGSDLTLISYGAMLHRTLDAAESLEEDGISVEVIDVLTISPLDEATILDSVAKTGRVVVVNEAHKHGGLAGEIIGRISETEETILSLEAPPKRVTGPDVQVPLFSREQHYMPDKDQILHKCEQVLEF